MQPRKYRLFTPFIVTLLATIATGFQYDGEWKRFAPPGSHFAVLMPGMPSQTRTTSETPGGKVVEHSYSLSTNSGLLEVIAAEYPFTPDAKNELRANRDQFIKDTNTKLISEWPINYRGNAGIEFHCANEESEFAVRVFIIGESVYEIAAGGYRKKIDVNEINRFLNSFQLVDD